MYPCISSLADQKALVKHCKMFSYLSCELWHESAYMDFVWESEKPWHTCFRTRRCASSDYDRVSYLPALQVNSVSRFRFL